MTIPFSVELEDNADPHWGVVYDFRVRNAEGQVVATGRGFRSVMSRADAVAVALRRVRGEPARAADPNALLPHTRAVVAAWAARFQL